MLNCSAINQFYGDSHTLWDMDLNVKFGSCTCLMGRNGVGKTTLLKSIMGVLPVRDGSIRFRGEEISRLKAPSRARLGIGYVPQGREIFPQLTVEENLRIGLTVRGKGGSGKTPELVFEIFPVLRDMLHRRGGDLSGGQQQQLAIGRALATSPDLLILDEPTEGIQPNIVREIGDVIKKLNSAFGITVLVVSQKLPFVRRVAESFCIMDRGRSVATGLVEGLHDNLIHEHLTV